MSSKRERFWDKDEQGNRMWSAISRPLRRGVLAWFLLTSFHDSSSLWAAQSKQVPAAGSIPTFEELLKLAKLAKQGTIPTQGVLNKIRDGLGFEPTKDQLKTLRDAGVNRKIVTAFEQLIPERTDKGKDNEIEKKTIEGHLSIYCEPVDCSFSINGDPKGETQGGKGQLELKEGSYAVKASAKNHQTREPEKPVAIKSGANAALSFHFEPSPEALQAVGRELFDRVAGQMGGQPDSGSPFRFKATGHFTLSGHEWGFAVFYRSEDDARFELSRGNTHFTAVHTGSGYKWRKKGSPPSAEASALEDVLMRICRFQASAIFQSIQSTHGIVTASRLVPVQGQNTQIRVEGNPNSYVILLDPMFHVKEIRIESSGLNNGIRALYGDYKGDSNHLFPGLTEIVFPDQTGHGIEVHFDSVTYNSPEVTDQVFAFKKGEA